MVSLTGATLSKGRGACDRTDTTELLVPPPVSSQFEWRRCLNGTIQFPLMRRAPGRCGGISATTSPAPVGSITSQDVMAVLDHMWSNMRPTVRKVRQRISAVKAWAVAQGLPKNGSTSGHHKATPHTEVADVLRRMREGKAPESAKKAAEFVALTAARVSEVTGITWSEVELEARTWTIPATGYKTRREPNVVPLSDKAVNILSH